MWAATLSDLAITALQERGVILTRNAHLPLAPRIAARWAVAVVLVALIAVTVTVASLGQTPQYEVSAKIVIGQEKDPRQAAQDPKQVQKLQELRPTMAEVTDSRPIAEGVIERLGLSTTPKAFLRRLNAEPIENTQFIEVSYTDPNPRRAQLVVNTVVEVFSKQVSEVSQDTNFITAMVWEQTWEQTAAPEEPVRPTPLRNGLLVLVLGLMLIVGVARPPWSGVTSFAEDDARQIARAIGRITSGARGTPTRVPVTEAAKEKELLDALRRLGELTAAEAALETSLTVEEAERVLSELAAKGHLWVRVRGGGIFYSFWERDAPE